MGGSRPGAPRKKRALPPATLFDPAQREFPAHRTARIRLPSDRSGCQTRWLLEAPSSAARALWSSVAYNWIFRKMLSNFGGRILQSPVGFS